MNLKEFIQKFIYQYFIILVGIFCAVIGYCKVFYPTAAFDANDLTDFFLQAFVADLPLIIMYSKKELSTRQYVIRRILHFILLEGAMVWIGTINTFFVGIKDRIGFIICVALVYVFVCVISYLVDMRAAKEMNQKIKERRKEKS